MARSSQEARALANGLLSGLFLRGRWEAGQLELAAADRLCRRDRRVRRLRGRGLAAAGEDDPERDLAPFDLLCLAELRLLAQLVDEVARRVVALRLQALVELTARVGGGVHVLDSAAGDGDGCEQYDDEWAGAHEAGSLTAGCDETFERPFEPGRRVGGVRNRVAAGEHAEVDAAVVAQDPDGQRLVARIERHRREDLAQRDPGQVERRLRPGDVRNDQVEHARSA